MAILHDGIWACRFTLAMIYYGIWDLPFYLAIGDKLFGTYRIEHRIGGLFVVCGCSIRVRGYLAVSYILGFRIMCRGIIRYMPRSVELPPRGAVDDVNDTTRALMITILPVYM